ncbi:hypothetical protein C0J52_28296 [Blattella germanica]|nr:hypothetical protein C0J52_28296 [Blattella germanica]
MENRVLDLAISGRMIVTDELLNHAETRHGTFSIWSQFAYIMKIVKNVINRGKLFKMTEKLCHEYEPDLEVNGCVMTQYLGICNYLKVLAKVSKYHGIAMESSIFVQLCAVSFLTQNKTDLTDDDLSDISVMLSKCSYAAPSEIPAILEKLAAGIQSSEETEVDYFSSSPGSRWRNHHCEHFPIPSSSRSLREYSSIRYTPGET